MIHFSELIEAAISALCQRGYCAIKAERLRSERLAREAAKSKEACSSTYTSMVATGCADAAKSAAVPIKKAPSKLTSSCRIPSPEADIPLPLDGNLVRPAGLHRRPREHKRSMKIAKIRFRKLTGTMETNGPFWEERLLRPIDIYPEYRRGGRTEGGEQVDDSICAWCNIFSI